MKKKNIASRPTIANSRKAIRKQKRQQKKIHRQEHYLKKRNTQQQSKYSAGKFVKRPADAQDPGEEPKKKKQKNQTSVQDILNIERQKDVKEAERLKSAMDKQRRGIFLQANEEEDKVIKKLEKQLGLNKSKNKNNYFADDGLDYLLEICDRTTSEQLVAAEKHLAEVEEESDFEEDLAAVTGKERSKKKDKNDCKKKEGEDHKSEDEITEEDTHDESILDEDSGEEFDIGTSDDEICEIIDESNDKATESGADGSDNLEEPERKPMISRKSSLFKNTEKASNKSSKKEEKQIAAHNKKEKIISEDDLNKVFSDDEVSHLSGDDLDDVSGHKGDSENDLTMEKQEKPDVWEDIYGRKRDKEGNVIKEERGTYVPPHLRIKDTNLEKDTTLLKRQIKSVLNKLAGTNLHWACSSIENLYNNNSRNSVNTCFSHLWRDATVGIAATPDRMVAEHAALIAVLHANQASDVGAHFLQELCKKFDEMMQSPQPVEDKRLDNLVSCLAHLYSFKIYHATLLYDILDRLLDELSEKTIECVLVALRIVGGVLRKEEPLALKNFIHDTQAKVAGLKESAATGSRIKFLLEVLMAVKNNNLTKIPNYDATYTEHLKKSIRGVIRKGNYITPLNIRLEDLLRVDERGKWWVVGSAWEGNRKEEKPTVKPASQTDQKLLELARAQRMNTDVRRSIFCVIMAAEDYMDAFEKLQHLGLKGQQEREIVHVLLACCLQEKIYNPYYAILGQKLCDTDRKYQLSIQYSVWDKIKDIENLSKQYMSNMAQFLVYLIMEKGLPLSVLKVIQFSDLNKSSVKFMRQILLAIIMNADLQASLEIFHRIAKPPKLHMFRESLKLFIRHFLIKNAGKKNSILGEDEMATLKERALEVEKILTMYESKMKF